MRKYPNIYDCSNSEERPEHNNISLGPKENTIVRDLKLWADCYGCKFVDDVNYADVIFTNDVFPSKILELNKPKVKRMDGVYWKKSLMERNERLNKSAEIADKVIFISNYSLESYLNLYNKNREDKYSVILNSVNNNFFYFANTPYKRFKFCASATNWAREEKRFDNLLQFMKESKESFALIGKCDFEVPKNCYKFEYIESESRIREILLLSEVFVNFSYRDAAPKVVCQAVSCGLPILFADSGGTPELIGCGIGIKDRDIIDIEEKTYKLDINDIMSSYEILMDRLDLYRRLAMEYSIKNRWSHDETMKKYFDVIRSVV